MAQLVQIVIHVVRPKVEKLVTIATEISMYNLRGHNFVILERDNQGNLFSALNAVTTKCVNGSVTRLEKWGLQTCDGYFTGTYNQTAAT